MNRKTFAVMAAVSVLPLAGSLAMAPAASASAVVPASSSNWITATAGSFGSMKCESATRHKTDYGDISLSLNDAPEGEIEVWLERDRDGYIFAGPTLVEVGMGDTTVATEVLAGTVFHTCAASPYADGGTYDGWLTY